MPAFASVVIDVDSTLCGVEGIDFLAERRGGEIRDRIIALTDKAMNGEIALESVYRERLTMIKPAVADVDALAQAYTSTVAPGAEEAITAMREAGVRLTLVSGGIYQAIEPVAQKLGFRADELHAVRLFFDRQGNYQGFDERSPLAMQRGKPEVVTSLIASGILPRPVLAVGDGATDALLRGVADAFAAYTGFAGRPSVVEQADLEIESFARLEKAVLRGARF